MSEDITAVDWEATPKPVKQLVKSLTDSLRKVEPSLTRMVQVSTLGTHLLSVPQEVVGKMSGKPLQATWKWSRRESALVIDLI